MTATVILGALAAFGALCLVWIGAGWLIGSGSGGTLLLMGQPKAMVSLLLRIRVLRELGIIRCPVWILDSGLEPVERRRLREAGFSVCSLSELFEERKNGVEAIDGTGDHPGNHRCGGLSEL